MVKHFVPPYVPIFHPRTLRPPPISRRSLTPRFPRARNLARLFRTALPRPTRPLRLRTNPHCRRPAPISRRTHRRRPLSGSSRLTPHRSLSARRLRHPTLSTPASRNSCPTSNLAPKLARCRYLPTLALAPAPPFSRLRSSPRRLPLVRSPPPLR